MEIFIWIIFIFSLLLFLIGSYCIYKAKLIVLKKEELQIQINEDIEEKENKLSYLKDKEKEIRNDIDQKLEQQACISQNLLKIKNENDNLYISERKRIDDQLKDYLQSTSLLKDKYISNLEEEYSIAEKNYIKKVKNLNMEIANTKNELDKIKMTMKANIEAQLRAKEIKEKLSFYCLSVTDSDKADIQKLENIKLSLNKPRILSMLIWQTWFQKPLKSLSANVLGTKVVTGIYKITNISTEECYIGQAADVASRFSDHAKCGLGIDTPANNKLYNAMKEYGLWNFSWELLEECPREQLNEKEKYYIELYQSYDYGYNSSRGIGTK